ncbi:MAG: carboxylating nicotinate-nucleotide diphosphorylase [Phycisphaeraceae bacterium]|nr:carboxylating nicotinate-nucleotide diphosphorylase [Phycisphaeraceae bacterium]
MKKLNIKKIEPLIDMAIKEDLGSGDVTSELLFKDDVQAEAHFVSREEIVVCGIGIAETILKRYDERLSIDVNVEDAKAAHIGQRLATVRGPLVPMLSAERVILNFLQRLCGISTTTRKYVQAIKGTNAKIYDTRKTLPGWRLLEKYAVRCGGGFNHRIGLYDGIMIKDNHFVEFGDCIEKHLSQLVQEAREVKHVKFVAVEVDHVDDQLNHVLAVPGVDIVLLDNMGQWQLQHAVQMRNQICGNSTKPLLEASGGITLDNIGVVASTGIDRIAVGAITHSATAVDIALDR